MKTLAGFLLGLAVFAATATGASDDARAWKAISDAARERRRAAEQRRENSRWRDEAVALEAKLVRKAEAYYGRRDFRKAKEYYLRALDITYKQWEFTERLPGGPKRSDESRGGEYYKPALRTRVCHLETHNTELARDRLKDIDRLIQEQELIEARLRADALFKAGKLAKAYARYAALLAASPKMGDNEVARRQAEHAQATMRAMLDEASAALRVARDALKAKKTREALECLDGFNRKYGELAKLPELHDTWRGLMTDPRIKKEMAERDAEDLLAKGDAAAARKDYLSATRFYHMAARDYPDTRAGTSAGAKNAALLADPEIVRAIELQKAEPICTGKLMRGRMLEKLGKTDEAVAVYSEVVNGYPDTPWAETAAKELARVGKAAAGGGAKEGEKTGESQAPE